MKGISNDNGVTGGPSQLIHMSKEDFGLENGDYGLAIERFKAKVNKGSKVFLIVNLNEVSYMLLSGPSLKNSF